VVPRLLADHHGTGAALVALLAQPVGLALIAAWAARPYTASRHPS